MKDPKGISIRNRAPAKQSADWRLSPGPAVTEPERRREPLLMKHWKYLWRHEFIEIRRGDTLLGTGHVDESTDDGCVIWVHLTNGRGRILLHHHDGIDVWRVDPRING